MSALRSLMNLSRRNKIIVGVSVPLSILIIVGVVLLVALKPKQDDTSLSMKIVYSNSYTIQDSLVKTTWNGKIQTNDKTVSIPKGEVLSVWVRETTDANKVVVVKNKSYFDSDSAYCWVFLNSLNNITSYKMSNSANIFDQSGSWSSPTGSSAATFTFTSE